MCTRALACVSACFIISFLRNHAATPLDSTCGETAPPTDWHHTLQCRQKANRYIWFTSLTEGAYHQTHQIPVQVGPHLDLWAAFTISAAKNTWSSVRNIFLISWCDSNESDSRWERGRRQPAQRKWLCRRCLQTALLFSFLTTCVLIVFLSALLTGAGTCSPVRFRR